MTCLCGNQPDIEACCGPRLSGARPADTAEALMRSRYTAYARGDIEYIAQTHDPETREQEVDREAIERWSKGAQWQRLEIVSTTDGGVDDDQGVVEFIAHYTADDASVAHHEVSHFRRVDGQWVYAWGEEPGPRRVQKVGRNSPCPCGSGKKYKKCCGRAA